MKRNSLNSITILLGLVAPAVGCSGGGNVNIGETQSVGSKLSDYAATWDGYAEAYTFQPSGSDQVHLVLDGSGSGTLHVGDETPLPPPTDPSVGYPPGVSQGLKYPLWDNFLYPVHGARVQTDRIQVGINPNDIESAWCALQTPIPDVETNTNGKGADATTTTTTFYGCLPNLGTQSGTTDCALIAMDGTKTPVDCDKLYLCNDIRACNCTADSCSSNWQPAGDAGPDQYPDELDAALDASGKTLTGTLTLGDVRVTVHLTRQ
jgi:hypothetical protein